MLNKRVYQNNHMQNNNINQKKQHLQQCSVQIEFCINLIETMRGGKKLVRFKVIKASKLLFYLAAGIFVLVLAVLAAKYFFSEPQTYIRPTANLVKTAQHEQDKAKTHTVFASQSTAIDSSLSLDPGYSNEIQIEIIPSHAEAPESAVQKRILIYHTHTHEAYEQVSNDPYVALEAWRTCDPDYSVVRVGKELASQLEYYGFEVVHDTTDHEGSELSTAYNRSLKTLKAQKKTFDLYIDLHRDAYIDGVNDIHKTADGTSVAQLMILIGNGEGFSEKPFFEENYAFAKKLTDRLNQISPNICKEVLIKNGRYNQHIAPFSILMEVGHNRNTLEQALASIPILAEAIFSLLIEEPDLQLTRIIDLYRSGMSSD